MFVILISILVIMYQALNILIFVPHIYQASIFLKAICLYSEQINKNQTNRERKTNKMSKLKIEKIRK